MKMLFRASTRCSENCLRRYAIVSPACNSNAVIDVRDETPLSVIWPENRETGLARYYPTSPAFQFVLRVIRNHAALLRYV